MPMKLKRKRLRQGARSQILTVSDAGQLTDLAKDRTCLVRHSGNLTMASRSGGW